LLYFVSLAGRNVVELIRTNGKFPSVFSNVNRKPWFGKEFNVVETRTTADLEPLRRSGHTRPKETTIGGLESRPENRENFDAKRRLNLSLSLYSVFISILIVFNDI
jgi:hypothetical protein